MFLQNLVAKTGDHDGEWLPLSIHLADTVNVTKYLSEHFLADSIWKQADVPSVQIKQMAVFHAYVHDIGKATALFQSRITPNLPLCRDRLRAAGADIPSVQYFSSGQATPHSLAGAVILMKNGCPDSTAEIIGAHHGSPSDRSAVDLQANEHAYAENYFDRTSPEQARLWHAAWSEIISEALRLSGFSDVSELPPLSAKAQMLLTGILIMADWIASNTVYFPLIPDEAPTGEIDLEKRALVGLRKLAFPEIWHSQHTCFSQSLFRQSFSFAPRIMQSEFLRIISECDRPGLFILEAPMGCGKTEAALMGADILAAKTDRSGIFFGLPSQATANGLAPRMTEWAQKQSEDAYHSIQLVHGAAAFHTLFTSLRKGIPNHAFTSDETDDCGLISHSWFAGSKQACLDQFVIGTVDRMLMMALKRRHIMLLHLGLSQKVVVIDECHAYDTYMNQYLEQALRWLGSYGTPVILLSATLPAKRRAALAAAYLQSKRMDADISESSAYPLLTWTDGGELQMRTLSAAHLHQTIIETAFLPESELVQSVTDVMNAGGCTGIILNTVRRAQAVAAQLQEQVHDAEIILCHAQFIQMDRADIEKKILAKVGKHSTANIRRRTIIIGTQVLEQSLDIDFDLLITDICPMDLLLQRMGRLHRHIRNDRPAALQKAVCRILGSDTEFERGSIMIYGEWLLKQTVRHLPAEIRLPADISPLVQAVYSAEDANDRAFQNYQNEQQEKRSSAKAFLLGKPKGANFSMLLDRSVFGNDTEAEASVRDGISSVEVLVVMQTADGKLRMLLHQENQQALDPHILPDDETCRMLAMQKLRLPSALCQHYNLRMTVCALESQCGAVMKVWGMSPWLHGQLLLIFDEGLTASVGAFRLTYDTKTGLHYESEAKA